MFVHLTIPFEPVAWAAPKLGRHGAYDIRAEDKRKIRTCIRQQYNLPPIKNYVSICLIYSFSIPKSTSKKNRSLMLAHQIYPTKSDCTNCQKLYEDCLKNIVIEDDRKVIKVTSGKFYAEIPGVFITINPLEGPPHEDNHRK